ncbi:hypothetical protein [Streptomyces sp. NBC_01012]|uniref:hypothetical protein n=1 Tax=Streptomyces sp. NBC_01012 TaxID=2903717 RepID=UPI0038640A2B|nr:hypothetical protein OG623_13590 [Streptomyces sp. NBC_01012]
MAIDLSFFRSESSQRLRAEGKAEGRAEGRAEGKAEGRAEAVVAVLERRGIAVGDDVRNRVLGCTDMETLDLWLGRALKATTDEELFGQA